MHSGNTVVLGVDFGAPRRARDQQRKIVAIAAHQAAPRRYRIAASGWNRRLLRATPPGWTAEELLRELLCHPATVVAFDFPFSVPASLLDDPAFAAAVGFVHGPFRTWRRFSRHVARRLPMQDPLDFSPFQTWRSLARHRLWARRETDHETHAQPPLKDSFPSLFQMTLLGTALLARLETSGIYAVRPFSDRPGKNEVIEVYPAGTLRALGIKRYKREPLAAIAAVLACCVEFGIRINIERSLLRVCTEYHSSAGADFDAADALVTLCTAILYLEGACVMAAPHSESGPPRDGVIWVPKANPSWPLSFRSPPTLNQARSPWPETAVSH